jgi:flagellar transcriptional activator FlhC
MAHRSIVDDALQIKIAIELIRLGARLQLLQEETNLSRERLLRLYKEIKGESPAKGMLPYSTDWFMSWRRNIHSSLFMDIYEFMGKHAGISGVEALIAAYRLYLDQVQGIEGDEPVMSVTRAWLLTRFFDAGMLQLTACRECGGHFVTHMDGLQAHYICGICRPPARAGKTKALRLANAALEKIM